MKRKIDMDTRFSDKLNLPLSPLGFGVMRLQINEDGTFPAEIYELLGEAYKRGVNYFDTAYPYLGGRSETLIREALVERYPRESFYIADKLPVWECHSTGDMERIFETQLERLGVGHIDFYLLHALWRSRWLECLNNGALSFLDKLRTEGKIRKVGFSFHDSADALAPILDAYDWDFAQLQINYYEWIAQNEQRAYNMLAERNIPCIVMEPVGGGKLAKLPHAAETVLREVKPDASAASWALRFVAGLPNVAVTLSGMSDMAQLTDNLSVFEPFVPLTESEHTALNSAVKILTSYNTIPCTACGYCVDVCPCNVDIPQIFKRYNEYKQFEYAVRFDIDYNAFIPAHRRADNCVSCGKCVMNCPQKIDIPHLLKRIHDAAAGLALG